MNMELEKGESRELPVRPVTRRSELTPQPAVYEIRVKGRLNGKHWAQWFDGMAVRATDDGETILRGPIADQAALYGLLSRLRDLALPLLSVNTIRRMS